MINTIKNIWNSFIIENSTFITTSGLLFCVIDSYVYMLLFTKILNIEKNYKQEILYVIVLSILCFFSKLLLPNPICIFVNMILLPFCVFFVFHTTKVKAVFAELITFSMSLALEYIIEKAFMLIFNVSLSSLVNIPLYRFAIISLIYSIVFILYLSIKHLNFSVVKLDFLNKKSKTLLLVNVILAIFILVTQFYLLSCYSDVFSSIMTLFNILSLFAHFAITIASFKNVIELESTSMSLEESQLSYKT